MREAIAAWGPLAERRLVVFVRVVLDSAWLDDEVAIALHGIPAWWTEPATKPEPGDVQER